MLSTSPHAQLKPIITSYPLQMVATDILGPLPESPLGDSYIIVVADYFTRYTQAYVIANQEMSTVAQKLVHKFFLWFSFPHSGQGRNFKSAVISKMWKLLGIQKSRTNPCHPQLDGLVERFNCTLLDMLATSVHNQPFKWEQHLPRLCPAYNTSVHPVFPHVRSSGLHASRHHAWDSKGGPICPVPALYMLPISGTVP